DAALFWPPKGKAYFFKGNLYIRYNVTEYAGFEGVDEGPNPIDGNWPGLVDALGLTADSGLDAAIYWPNGYAYFLKGNMCVKYASGVHPNEPEGVVGAPVDISSVFAELKSLGFDVSSVIVNAAVYWPNGLVYLLFADYSLGLRPGRDLF